VKSLFGVARSTLYYRPTTGSIDYHAGRPHSALGYLTPNEYRGRLAA